MLLCADIYQILTLHGLSSPLGSGQQVVERLRCDGVVQQCVEAMDYALCTMHYALWTTDYAQCTIAFGS